MKKCLETNQTQGRKKASQRTERLRIAHLCAVFLFIPLLLKLHILFSMLQML